MTIKNLSCGEKIKTMTASSIKSGTALLFIVSCTAWHCQSQKDKLQNSTNRAASKHKQIENRIDSTLTGIQPIGSDSNVIRSNMVFIKGGMFTMGYSGINMPDAMPLHDVTLDDFWIDETPVTNDQFTEFVRATGYKTVAERPLDPKDFPGVPLADLEPGSIVFTPPNHAVSLDNAAQWWKYLPGANWQHPEGPGSSIKGRENHPVVHICWEDAMAFCKWGGKRLPTEAEFEYAARGGKHQQHYSWGNELVLNGKWMANIWQGEFPINNTMQDGYASTSPVKAFPSNGYGLYDVSGNVWQWCSDWYRPDYYQLNSTSVVKNPQGPDDSFDPFEPGMAKKVQRSGSFMCSDQYCVRYLVGSRGKGEVFSSSSNVGFRCAL
jgi:formylglycine-generating enzyme required for sulfatase activity